MMKKRSLCRGLTLSVGVFSVLTAASLAMAAGRSQPVAPDPAAVPTANADGRPAPIEVPIFVREVVGNVRAILEPGGALVKVETGMLLKPGAEILTGIRSLVRVQVGAGQIFTIDRQSRVRLSEVINRAGTETTRIDLPYGRLTFDVTSTQFANDVKIQAPDATLAVKGTSGGMEVVAGQPTTAFGGEFNTGRFEVEYDTGVLAAVTGSESTSADHPAPAMQALAGTTSESSIIPATDPDEAQVLAQQQGGGSTSISAGSNLRQLTQTGDRSGMWGSELQGALFYELVERDKGLALLLRDRYGNARTLLTNLLGLGGVLQGMTVVNNPDNPAQRWILALTHIVDPQTGAPIPVLKYVNADESGQKFQLLNQFPPDDKVTGSLGVFLRGLAALGQNVYSTGIDFNSGELGYIYQLPFAGALIPRMMLGVNLVGGIASSGRGTLMVLGEIPAFGDTYGPEGGQKGGGPGAPRQFLLLELDPVSNAVVNGWWSGAGAFDTLPGTVVSSPGLSIDSLQQVTGIAYVGDRMIITGITKEGQTITIQYNPGASNTPADPAMERIDFGNRFAFGGVGVGAPGVAPQPLSLSNPTYRVETAHINPIFAQMGYTTQARMSGVVGAMLREQILATARDPLQCLNSGALGSLGDIAAKFDNQRSGFGQSVAMFRDMLPPGHPCLPIVVALNNGNCGCSGSPPTPDR
jgi:hypothetical protein